MIINSQNLHHFSLKEQQQKFLKLPLYEQANYLINSNSNSKKHLLSKLSLKKIEQIISHLDPDEAANIIRNIDEKKRKKFIEIFNHDYKEKINFLLQFNPQSAAAIMSLNYILIDSSRKVKDIKKEVIKHEQKTGKFPELLITHKGQLIGELPGHELILKKENTPVKNHVKKVATIHSNTSHKELIHTFKIHRHQKIVVLDNQKLILGIIYSDDILKIIHQSHKKSLYDYAGVSNEEEVFDSAITKVKNRYKWLLIHLLTAFIAVFVISFFENTLESLVLLAFYMPVVAGMGGNAGTQTLAVVIRGLALKEITLQNSKKVIINEILAGTINGIINGVAVAIFAILFNQNILLGLILFLAMIFNLIIAGLFGAITPLILEKLGKDPASSAVTFITAATDIFGFLIFLGLASLLL